MQKELQQWMAVLTKQQSELADIGAGLFDISVQGISDWCDLNFGSARRHLAHAAQGTSAFSSPEESFLAFQKMAEQSINDIQAYIIESSALFVRLQKQSQSLVTDHLNLVQASTDHLIDQTHKLSPGASDAVGSALRSWVSGAQSAVVQMNQMSSHFSEMANGNGAAMAAWKRAKAPGKGRSNGMSAS